MTTAGTTDRFALTIPADARFRTVATLVLGGIGSRLSLPYERIDELQLAILSLLDAGSGDELRLEVEASDERVTVSLGPLAQGTERDEGLALVLSRLVDSVEPDRRDGAEWMTVSVQRPSAA